MEMATTTKRWTLEELDSLPDDGNKYELVRGALFVTPAPAYTHEAIAARLLLVLVPYVAAHHLGWVHVPRSVVQFQGSQVEPDLMVRAPHPDPKSGWATAPVPILIVEILSPYTRRRDMGPKRELYADAGIPEYWIVDPEQRRIQVIRPGQADVESGDLITWSPAGAASPLTIAVAEVFG